MEWDPQNVTIDRNMPYVDKTFVAEMYRKRSKGILTYIFHAINLILGLITDSLVEDTALEQLILAINVKEAYPRRISNGNPKENMEHKKGTVRNVGSKLETVHDNT